MRRKKPDLVNLRYSKKTLTKYRIIFVKSKNNLYTYIRRLTDFNRIHRNKIKVPDIFGRFYRFFLSICIYIYMDSSLNVKYNRKTDELKWSTITDRYVTESSLSDDIISKSSDIITFYYVNGISIIVILITFKKKIVYPEFDR